MGDLDEARWRREAGDNRQLLVDTFTFRRSEPLVEGRDSEGRKTIRGRGTFGFVDVPTANGRVYKREIMSREINRLAAPIRERKVPGELDHPEDGKTKARRVSHLITFVEVRDDGEIYGELEAIPGTSSGDDLIALLEAEVKLGVSSRGFGTTTKNANGDDVVNEDYTLITWDVVIDPAAASAYPRFFRSVSGAAAAARASPGAAESRERAEGTRQSSEDAMTLAEMKEKDPEGYKAMLAEAALHVGADKLREAREEGRRLAEESAKEEMRKALPGIVEDVRQRVEEQHRADPKLGGALDLVERLKPIMAPYVVGGDAAKALEERDREIADLKNKLAEGDVARQRIAEELDEAVRIGLRAMLGLHLETRLGDHGKGTHPCAAQLRTLVGTLHESMTIAQLDEKLETCADRLYEERAAQRRQDQEILRLREDKARLEALLSESTDAALEVAVAGYIAKKCATHHARTRLENAIRARKPQSKAAVDQLYEDLAGDFPRSRLAEDVRRGQTDRRSRGPFGTNNGDQAEALTEGRERRGGDRRSSFERLADENVYEGEIMGVPIQEMVRLSGATPLTEDDRPRPRRGASPRTG